MSNLYSHVIVSYIDSQRKITMTNNPRECKEKLISRNHEIKNLIQLDKALSVDSIKKNIKNGTIVLSSKVRIQKNTKTNYISKKSMAKKVKINPKLKRIINNKYSTLSREFYGNLDWDFPVGF